MFRTHTITLPTFELITHELLKCLYLSTQSLNLSLNKKNILTIKKFILIINNTYLPTQNNYNKKFLRIWNNNVPNKPKVIYAI
jgi:hypothetical protein